MEEKKVELAENQIREKQRIVDYDVKEFTIELLVNKYSEGLVEDVNEIYIPAYQREFVWDDDRKSKFIESILLGLPIPYIFTAESEDGRLEVVDGSQRLRTLTAFIKEKFCLKPLEILTELKGFSFDDLPIGRQRKVKNSTIRMITLSEKSDEDVRYMMFERLNTGSEDLKDQEVRKGSFQGQFTDFVYKKCAENKLFKKLTSFTEKVEKRGEPQELIIRFFAYRDNYLSFTSGVNDFLNNYTIEMNKGFDEDKYYTKFEEMLKFVEKYIPNGFKKNEGSSKTPRVRFEALSVGISLALEENKKLKPTSLSWLESDEYLSEVTGGSHNTPARVKSRINYVKNKLLIQ